MSKGERKKNSMEKEHDDKGSMMPGGEWVLSSMTKGDIVEWDCNWCQRSSKYVKGQEKSVKGHANMSKVKQRVSKVKHWYQKSK